MSRHADVKALKAQKYVPYLPNLPIVISKLPNCSSQDKVTFPKHCYIIRQEQKYNKQAMMKDRTLFLNTQGENIESDLYCNYFCNYTDF